MSVATLPRHVPSAPPTTTRPSERLPYLDNLKTVLIVTIIAAHAAFSYVATSWQLRGFSITSLVQAGVSLVLTVGVVFAMGAFFFMAGLLAAKSLAHRGFQSFVSERLLRLGVPYLVLIPIVWPVVNYFLSRLGSGESLWTFWAHELTHMNSGALWFILVLLVYSVAYAGWRAIRPAHLGRRSVRPLDLVVLAAVIGAATFAIRIFLPMDSEQFLNVHLWQWPQCAGMFWFGAVCGERGWLTSLPDRWWRVLGGVAAAAVVAVPVLLLTGGGLSGHEALFKGGWHWQAAVAAGLEGVLAVSATLWLLEYFRRRYNHQGHFARTLTRSAYAAYLVQFGALVALGVLMQSLTLSGEVKFLLVAPSAIVISFAVAWLIVIRFKIATRIL